MTKPSSRKPAARAKTAKAAEPAAPAEVAEQAASAEPDAPLNRAERRARKKGKVPLPPAPIGNVQLHGRQNARQAPRQWATRRSG